MYISHSLSYRKSSKSPVFAIRVTQDEQPRSKPAHTTEGSPYGRPKGVRMDGSCRGIIRKNVVTSDPEDRGTCLPVYPPEEGRQVQPQSSCPPKRTRRRIKIKCSIHGSFKAENLISEKSGENRKFWFSYIWKSLSLWERILNIIMSMLCLIVKASQLKWW